MEQRKICEENLSDKMSGKPSLCSSCLYSRKRTVPYTNNRLYCIAFSQLASVAVNRCSIRISEQSKETVTENVI